MVSTTLISFVNVVVRADSPSRVLIEPTQECDLLRGGDPQRPVHPERRIVRIKAVPPDRVYGRFLIGPRLAVSDSKA
jgi:hypothetical protein